MKRINVFILLFLYFCNCYLVAQDNGWEPAEEEILRSKEWKIDGKIKYFVDSAMHMSQRNEIIHKTKQYISDNLKFINESNFDDSLYLVITSGREEMKKLVGMPYTGLVITKDSSIPVDYLFTVYGEEGSSLKHELMHIVSFNKWGETCGARVSWLTEGLAMLADPDLDNCEDRTFEEKYVYFLQTNRLINTKGLINRPGACNAKMPEIKIFYAQSAYIVQYLIENYGMDKIKRQWISSIDCFEEIFGFTFDELTQEINNELIRKYPNPINLDWEKFNQRDF